MPGTRQAVAGSRHTLYIRLLHSGKFSLHNPVSDPGLRNTRLHFMVTYQFVICYGRFQVIKATRIVSIQPPGQFYDMRGYQETAVHLPPEHFGHGYRCFKASRALVPLNNSSNSTKQWLPSLICCNTSFTRSTSA